MKLQTGILGKPIPGIKISGTGSAFPLHCGRFWTNNEIHELLYGKNWEKFFAENKMDSDYFQKNYGFEKRYWVHAPGSPLSENEATSADLMEIAAREALESSKLSGLEIDVFIAVSTTSPKYTTSLGAIVGGRLNISSATLEIKSGCSSSIYAGVLAAQFISNGAEHVLVAAAETLSKVASSEPGILYSASDGAGAVVFSRSENPKQGILSWYLDSDGSYTKVMGVPGLLPPISNFEKKDFLFQYKDIPEEFILNAWKKAAGYWKEIPNSKKPDVLLPHQVNRKIIRIVSEFLEMKSEDVLDRVDKVANCGSASILAVLDHSYRDKKIKAGDTILFAAAGGGISWGGFLLQT
ncbi:hypothetical protein JWG44_05185 [Leptospira sp. 201903071]|uniref:3-oxoacyl-ACP synthase III family protein n=1 Tax=Leptospira ainazelensis TaxID=2810034 RepID=UPI0019631A1C|nr:3-oxoacyl-[acyl-carrier-protein] synthase III C-terminal domain-containing protein [Leptospira ainazelensis]MBM9499642.1 hypothetical protein [Leptospira ainazelensis]